MRQVFPFVVILLLSAGVSSSAQTYQRGKAVYGELLGASQGIGVNYDSRFKVGVSDGFGWRAGLGFGYAYSTNFVAFSIREDKIDTYNQMFRLAVPLEVNYLLGKGKSKFETGLGTALCLERYTSQTGAKPENSFGCVPFVSLGYRLVTNKGFLFRTGVIPTYNIPSTQVSFYPFLSFGRAF